MTAVEGVVTSKRGTEIQCLLLSDYQGACHSLSCSPNFHRRYYSCHSPFRGFVTLRDNYSSPSSDATTTVEFSVLFIRSNYVRGTKLICYARVPAKRGWKKRFFTLLLSAKVYCLRRNQFQLSRIIIDFAIRNQNRALTTKVDNYLLRIMQITKEILIV